MTPSLLALANATPLLAIVVVVAAVAGLVAYWLHGS